MGAMYPIITSNKQVSDQSSSTTVDNDRKSEGRNHFHLKEGRTWPPNNIRLWHEHLTGLVGWWRRVDKEGERREELLGRERRA